MIKQRRSLYTLRVAVCKCTLKESKLAVQKDIYIRRNARKLETDVAWIKLNFRNAEEVIFFRKNVRTTRRPCIYEKFLMKNAIMLPERDWRSRAYFSVDDRGVHYFGKSSEISKEDSAAFRNARKLIQQYLGKSNCRTREFKWIRKTPMDIHYDELVFSYKRSVFSVEILSYPFFWSIENGEIRGHSLFTYIQRNACVTNKMIACVFLVNEDGSPYSELGCNLRDAETLMPIDPQRIASSEPTPYSPWERNAIAINYVVEFLKKQGNKIDSYCDMLEVNPQICFHKEGKDKHKWCKVVNAVGDLTDKQCDELILAAKNGREVQIMRDNTDFNGGCVILVNFIPEDGQKLMRQAKFTTKYKVLWLR